MYLFEGRKEQEDNVSTSSTCHVLVEECVLLLNPKPRLETGGGLERFHGVGASVGRDGLAGGQAGLAEDQDVVSAAEGVLRVDVLHTMSEENKCNV